MKQIFNTLMNASFRFVMRLFMPDLAQQMDQEGMLCVDAGPKKDEIPEYIRVEDRGADTTIFAFSGLDVLYAGLARFEFQKVLHSLGIDANLVFVRDVHRMGFHLCPDGNPGGVAFYEDAIKRTMKELGASTNIAIGSSIGGSAAFYSGTRCAMQQVVIFGAAFELGSFTNPRMVLRTFFDVPKLFREPGAYFEMVIVTLSAMWGQKRLVKQFGEEELAKPLDAYDKATDRPAVTLFYGETAWPDAAQARLLGVHSEARLVPLATGRHNTPAFLKQRGEFASSIADAIAYQNEQQSPACTRAVV